MAVPGRPVPAGAPAALAAHELFAVDAGGDRTTGHGHRRTSCGSGWTGGAAKAVRFVTG